MSWDRGDAAFFVRSMVCSVSPPSGLLKTSPQSSVRREMMNALAIQMDAEQRFLAGDEVVNLLRI